MWAIGRPMGYWILVNDFSREGDVGGSGVGLDIRSNEEQGGNKLRGLGGIKGDRLALIERLTRDAQRRKTLFAQVVNVRTDAAESVHQLTNRAMMHAFDAVQDGGLPL